MKRTKLIIGFALTVTLLACSKYEFRWVKKMEGTWNVTNYNVTEIDSTGNSTTLLDQNDAGTYTLSESSIDNIKLEGIFDLKKDIKLNGTHYSDSYTGTIDEEGMRIKLFGGTCIQCDSFYTIEVNKKNEQVWTRYDVGAPWTKTTKIKISLSR